jgi:hypothetical protein
MNGSIIDHIEKYFVTRENKMHFVYVLVMHAFTVFPNAQMPEKVYEARLAVDNFETLPACEAERVSATNKMLSPVGKAFLDARHIDHFYFKCDPQEIQ